MALALAARRLAPSSLRQAPVLWQAAQCYATGAGSKVVELTSDDEYESALKQLAANKSAAIIDFTAVWCGPCKMMAPLYEEMAAEFDGKVKFYKIDIDKAELTKSVVENSVAAVPTFVGYQGADRVTAFSGADKAMLRRMATELSGGHLKAPGQ